MTHGFDRPATRSRGRLIAFTLAGLGFLWLMLGFLSFPGGEGWGFDYRAYADAAVRLADTGTPYQAETLDGPYRPGPYGLYMYAPPLAVGAIPLVGLDLDTGISTWYLLHVALLAAACALMPVNVTVRLATFGVAALSFGVMRDLVLGNVSLLLVFLLVVAWRWLDKPLGSVAQAVAISIRPTLGVLLVWQLLRRRWVAVAWTVGAGVTLILLTLPFVGFDGYRDYVTVLRNLTGVSGVDFNYDIGSTALSLGATDAVSSVALLTGYAVAIVAIALSLRRDGELGYIVTASASLLLSPLLWDHYLSMLVLPAAFLAQRGRRWALILPLLTWLPVFVPAATFLFPLLAFGGTVLPLLARAPRSMPHDPARAVVGSAASRTASA
jgi:alpha-1,2-mannosyltransferase